MLAAAVIALYYGCMEMIYARYSQVDRAEAVRRQLQQMDQAQDLRVANMAVITHERVHESGDPGPYQGRELGGFVGGTVGFISGVWVDLAGAVIGALIGGTVGALIGGVITERYDSGIDNRYMRDLSAHLTPDQSLLLVVVPDRWADEAAAVAAEGSLEIDRYIVDARLSARLADEDTAFQVHRQYRPRR
jgi:uncharacterized membrane protein